MRWRRVSASRSRSITSTLVEAAFGVGAELDAELLVAAESLAGADAVAAGELVVDPDLAVAAEFVAGAASCPAIPGSRKPTLAKTAAHCFRPVRRPHDVFIV